MPRCPTGILLIFLAATQLSAAELCLAPSHPSGLNGSVACDIADTFVDNDWIGYDTGGVPCNAGSAGYCIYGDPPPQFAFCWSISSSVVDPYVNAGPLADVSTLFLWLAVAGNEGLASTEFYLAGDLNVVAVNPMNGFVLSQPGLDPREVRLSVAGCPTGPLVAAAVLVAGTVDVESQGWGVMKATYR